MSLPVVTLRDLREATSMSLRELERRSGVNRALLSRFERGLATPQRHELRLLEAALELEPGELQPRIVLMLDVEPGRLPLLFEPRDEEGSHEQSVSDA